MIRRPPRSTLDRSSAASDVYKRQVQQSVRSGTRGGRAGAAIDVGERPPFTRDRIDLCLLYTSPSPRDRTRSRMQSSA